MSRRLIAAAAALTTAAMIAPSADAARVRCSSKLSAATTTVGTPVRLTGTVRPRRVRTIALQVRRGARWTKAAGTKSSRKGRFSFSVPVTKAGTLVLRARAGTSPCGTRSLKIAAAQTGVGINPSEAGAHAWRAVYALASDQTADPDHPAAIAGTIGAVDGWYATQTIGHVQPRWFRNADGSIAVTTVTLDHTRAEYDAAGDNHFMIAGDLIAHGLPPQDGTVKLAVYIDVSNTGACGSTAGDIVIMFEAACDIHPGVADQWPYGATYLLGHEMAHGFGAVEDCAPHAGAGGHVLDDPKDVLYAGDAARDWDHLELDPGHDDYYATGRADCPGIESSPFWTTTADPGS